MLAFICIYIISFLLVICFYVSEVVKQGKFTVNDFTLGLIFLLPAITPFLNTVVAMIFICDEIGITNDTVIWQRKDSK